MTDIHPEYPKINGLYKRGEKGRIIEGEFSRPEFEYLRALPWEWTEKVDGTNIRLGCDFSTPAPPDGIDPTLYIGGRTDRAQIPPDLLERLQHIAGTIPWADCFPDVDVPITLYGEGYGARIQKGGGNYIPDGVDFVLFDVKVGPFWLSRENVEDVAAKLGLDVVPLVDFGTAHGSTAPIDVAESFVANDWFKSRWPGVERPEGLVGRPAVPLFNNRGERITTKIKWRDYA